MLGRVMVAATSKLAALPERVLQSFSLFIHTMANPTTLIHISSKKRQGMIRR